MIVATAGHVDHGKTTLIRALTGVDTDRLPEEKARGLTIDLGYAYRPLPDGSVMGFIDVPGHERFVRNMVAGVAAIDLALLVVAADDGVMPQTREHVAVLDLLGVPRALVALTKCDRAEAAQRDAVAADVSALLAPTAMAGAPVLPVATPDGTGIPALLAALEEAAAALATTTSGGFRLAVDRVFVLKGAGTVVTGTIHAGSVAVGDRLAVMPWGHAVRVRSIHAQDRPADMARQGERAALNLAGIDHDAVARGDWIARPDLLRPSVRLDVALRVLASEERPLRHWTPVHVHLGAGSVPGRVAVLGEGALEPGSHGRVQIVLDRPLVAAFGDHVVLRDQSARRTIAGGRIVDPESPARGRARPERLARLEAMDRAEPAAALSALLELGGEGVEAGWFARARNLPDSDLAALLERVPHVPLGRGTARLLLAPARWAEFRAAVLTAVAEDHAAHADRLGPDATRLANVAALKTSRALINGALAALVAEGLLRRRGAVIHLPGHSVTLAPADRSLWQRIETELDREGVTPPALYPLADGLGQTPAELERFLERMAGFGLVQKIARNRWLTPARIDAFGEAARRAAEGAGAEGFTAAAFRDAAGIGRNLAIDVLEFLDRSGITLRRGDLRQIAAVPVAGTVA